jgi:PadR family transcriptional regulator PadR
MIYLGSVTEHTRTYARTCSGGAIAMSRPTDLVQGTLDLLVLTILAVEPMNGHAIGMRLQQMSGDVLKVSDGSLYPALHKLEQEGWLTASWQTTENNRRAKVYALSRSGRRRLEKETDNWLKLSGAITQLVQLTRT